jgi:hypothetical protein
MLSVVFILEMMRIMIKKMKVKMFRFCEVIKIEC